MKKVKVFVGMSGGVDSSVTAALLKKRGFDVVGVFIKSYNVDGCSEQDSDDARRVAEQLKIPFYVFDLEKEYKEKVVRYMIDGYKNGLTPNPDVMCNKEIKFGLFLKRALELGADYVATGHYVRLRNRNPNLQIHPNYTNKLFGSFRLNSGHSDWLLFQAKDKNKDQSYFLWTLNQNQLKHCLFPIGGYTKSQVRQIAKKFGLITANKKDSQGICFLGKVSIVNFLKNYIPEKKGLVLNTAGEKIGEHKGVYFYTIGQRHGLGIGGSIKPRYVIEKNIETNTIVVAEGGNNKDLFRKEVGLVNISFVNPRVEIRNKPISVSCRVRYHQPLFGATIYKIRANSYKLIFATAQKFVAPGQSAVFYNKKGEMLGGGIIV